MSSVAKGTMKAPQRLQPLKTFRVKRPNKVTESECVGIMQNVLTCWASSGYTAKGCTALEQTLRACMDKPRQTKPKKSTINYHMMRLYPKIIGPHKRK